MQLFGKFDEFREENINTDNNESDKLMSITLKLIVFEFDAMRIQSIFIL